MEPYSQAIVSRGFVLPIAPLIGKIPENDIEKRAHIVLKNLAAIAKTANTSLWKAVKTTVFYN